MSILRSGLAALALTYFVAGCVSAPERVASVSPTIPAADVGFPMDPAFLGRRRLQAVEQSPKRHKPETAVSRKYNLETEADELGPPTAAQILRANEQRHAIERSASLANRPKIAGIRPNQWQPLGPSNVGGRVRSIAFDPQNPSRMLVGTATGGLWTSEDGGATWRANSDFLPNLSITTLAFDVLDPRTVYLGTGEFSQGFVGLGAFKSTDRGATWVALGSTDVDRNPDWRFVNRIAAHPTQSRILLAGVTNVTGGTGAIYRSADGGDSWAKVFGGMAMDLAFDPADPANAAAGLNDGTVAYSRDGGLTWTRSVALATPVGDRSARIEIAFSRAQRGLVYASVDNAKGEVWKSTDSGATWQFLSRPEHLREQGYYDNAIWADPTDALHVVIGGINLHQSRDGGTTFLQVSNSNLAPASPHADHHALVSPPNFGASNPVLYDGNDGGVYRAANIRVVSDAGGPAGGWTNMNNGLAVTQFYAGAGHAAAGGRIIGGTQDNGSYMLDPTNTWRKIFGGDGGVVATDPVSDQTLFGEYVFLAIFRSLNGGNSSEEICAGIEDALAEVNGVKDCGTGTESKANFIAPFILDPNNRNRMFAGGASLWLSENVQARGVTWRSIKAASPTTDNFINAIAVQEGNANVVWVGYNNGEVHRTADALAAAPTWTRVGQTALPARRAQRITLDKDNPSRAIVAFTGFSPSNLWQTLDGGSTWSSITGNLPSAPIFDVKRHPRNPAWLYVATSVGVYASESGGATWTTTNDGPANIRVRELFWYDDTTLVAATFGRGMFKVAVPANGPANYQDLWWAGSQENGWGMSITQHGSVLFAALYIYDAQGQPQWVVFPGGSWNADFSVFTGDLYIPSGAWFGSYDASRFVVGPSVGRATLAFSSATTATLSYTINGVSGTKAITRQAFGPQESTPVATYSDLWWGGSSQNGWGVAINQQYRTLFSVWYTYDSSGRTVWYVIPGGTWTAANTYSGAAYRVTSSPWLGTPYNPAAFSPQAVGNVTFTFTDLDNAVMTYTVDGVTQTKNLSRQPF